MTINVPAGIKVRCCNNKHTHKCMHRSKKIYFRAIVTFGEKFWKIKKLLTLFQQSPWARCILEVTMQATINFFNHKRWKFSRPWLFKLMRKNDNWVSYGFLLIETIFDMLLLEIFLNTVHLLYENIELFDIPWQRL